MMTITWRTATPDDAPALLALEAACYRVDNPCAIPLAHDYAAALRMATATRCLDHNGKLVAAAWLLKQTIAGQDRLLYHSYLHPEYRGRGINVQLLTWAQDVARQTGAAALVIRSEANTAQIDSVFQQQGFERIFAEEIMRFDLHQPLPVPRLPSTLQVVTWSDQTAPEFYRVFADAFRDRPGFVAPPEEDWIVESGEGEGFRPDLSLLAIHPETGEGQGFVLCDMDTMLRVPRERIAWIAQVGVRQAGRRHGIGSALLLQTMQSLAAEQVDTALLHVNVNNPGAIRVYMKLGFQMTGRRARYQRRLDVS